MILLVFEIALSIIIFNNKDVKTFNKVMRFIFYSYLFFIYFSTIFSRINWQFWNIEVSKLEKIKWFPFYSYFKLMNGEIHYFQEIIMNIVIFIPIGFIICYLKNDRKCILDCIFLSFMIEISQFIYSCGLCEIDDIIHNSLGGCLGLLLYQLGKRYYMSVLSTKKTDDNAEKL